MKLTVKNVQEKQSEILLDLLVQRFECFVGMWIQRCEYIVDML